VIGLEAGGGAHHWAGELIRPGHDARLMPPQDVKAYVKRNKHDAAEALLWGCAAATHALLSR
jgi:transposase